MHFVGGPSAMHSEGAFEGLHSMGFDKPPFLFHLMGGSALEAAGRAAVRGAGASAGVAARRCRLRLLG